ncbi:MAG TPA: SDR family NAD(P)-dependent oxidoreductase [Acidimicrobiales bacterium]|nr:SDR family NAD(P)-dependent oxidoreductase [Acidimicrobiales bacterium]
MERLDGRAAVVTGAASGIGLAVATALAAEGVRVLLTDHDAAALDVAVDGVRALVEGADVDGMVVDVRDPDAVEAAADRAVERFGGLHIAMSNAGIVNGGPAWELPLEEWHRVLDVNLWGVIHGIRAFVPRILATGEEGHVVNTGSRASVVAHGGLGPYTVAKHGVLALSDVLRKDLQAAGAPVGVSIVMPGAIRTGMNPLGDIEPATVAANVVDAIRTGRRYVFTDDQGNDGVRRRLGAIVDALDEVLPPT